MAFEKYQIKKNLYVVFVTCNSKPLLIKSKAPSTTHKNVFNTKVSRCLFMFYIASWLFSGAHRDLKQQIVSIYGGSVAFWGLMITKSESNMLEWCLKTGLHIIYQKEYLYF